MWEVVIRCNRQCRTDRDSRTREGGLQKNIMVMLQLLFLNIEVQDLSFTLTYAILLSVCTSCLCGYQSFKSQRTYAGQPATLPTV